LEIGRNSIVCTCMKFFDRLSVVTSIEAM